MSPIEHPVVILLQILERAALQAKRFPEQPLSPITANCGRGYLSRDSHSQPMIGATIGEYKGRDQRALIALAFFIDLLELAAAPQIDFHVLLVMRRGEPFSSFGPASLQN